MKILSGLIYHESNTFNPMITGREQFVVVEGEELLDRLASTEVFRAAGAQIVPAVYAMALSSGVVEEQVYQDFKGRLLAALDEHPDVDGIWLHLHGAMTVEGVGAAEDDLLEAIRARVGRSLPISLTLDPHGNISPKVAELSTVLRGYRTIPHIDQPEIERRTAQHLVDIIRGKFNAGAIAHRLVPFALSGEKALSEQSPLRQIIEALDEVEAIPGILDATFFVGFAWADVPQNSASVVVVPKGEEYRALAEEQAQRLADYILEQYPKFDFQSPTLPVDEAVAAIHEWQSTPVVVSDSGDNTTGGAAGFSTVLLRELLAQQPERPVCLTTVFDPAAVRALAPAEIGDHVSVRVGMAMTDYSQPVVVEGVLKAKGDLLGYMSSEKDKVGNAYTVAVGNLDIVLTDISGSFVTLNHFRAAGLRPEDYEAVVLKQGYMFPEIAEFAGSHVLALTPGGTYQLIENLPFQNVNERVYARARKEV